MTIRDINQDGCIPIFFTCFGRLSLLEPPHVLQSKQTILIMLIMLIFLVALLKWHVTINPLLTSTSDSTSPDKLLKFPSYMPLFGEKDKSKQRAFALSNKPTPPRCWVCNKISNISGLRLRPSRFEEVGPIIPLRPVSSLWESQFTVASQEALI